jgi:hypothetical protein
LKHGRRPPKQPAPPAPGRNESVALIVPPRSYLRNANPNEQAGERFPDIHCGQSWVPGLLQNLRRPDRRGGSEKCPGHNPHDRREKSKKPHLIGETKNQLIMGLKEE